MLNLVAKGLLASTSLSPVLLVWAVSAFERGHPWTTWTWPLVTALLLVLICKALLKHAQSAAQQHLFHVKEIESKDREVLTFLLIYSLPFVRGPAFANEWITAVVVLTIIVTAIVQTDTFHFNPVMCFLGYRFYAVKDGQGIPNLLISRADLRQPGADLPTVRLAPEIYLHTESGSGQVWCNPS